MYPEVEKCFAAIEAAGEKYDAILRTTPAHVRGASKEECPACKVMTPATDERHAARTAAWNSLKESPNPLVRWIAENCQHYVSEATEVLKALPAPMAELDAIASRKGWCDTWDYFKRMAERAGVLPAAVSADTEVSA